MANIESPQTFGEFYWNMSVEAQKFYSELAEQQYGPVIAGLLADSGLDEIIPPALHPLFSILKEPPSPSWDEIQKPFLGLVSRAVALAGGEQMAKPFVYEANEKFLAERIGVDAAVLLHQRRKIDQELYEGRMHSAGYADSESRHLYSSKLPYPSMQELIRYGRYHGNAENPKDFVWNLFDISPDDWDMWNWLSFQKLTTEQVQSVYRRGGWEKSRASLELARLGWPDEEQQALLNTAFELPNAMLLLQGDLFQGMADVDILADVSKAGIHPEYASQYMDGVLTKPSTQDLIAYQLRIDPSLQGLTHELRRTGVHPDYHQLFQTLAYPIPPVNDLITMAVREVFTPEIAARFGQYEGLPKEYVAAAQQKGLSQEWAERYWAAHWTLPSVSQGFAMLHRGIIDQSDLNLLLRALDIMPFWRDKLVQLSYKPLTRVDVRRMHLLGTLDDAGVKKAYQDVGYSDYNAGKMTDFTIRYNRRSLSGFTPRDAITAYINRLIGAGEAQTLLRDIGVKQSELSNIMKLAGKKREWKRTTEHIEGISNLYRKGKLDESATKLRLQSLGLDLDFVNTSLEQWEAKADSEKTAAFTNAQTLKLLTMGLIDATRADKELQLLGFDTERRALLLASIQVQTG